MNQANNKTKYLLYAHSGSYNHGSEAIARATIEMIRKKHSGARVLLSSHFPEQDREVLLDADAIFGPDEAAWALEKKAVAKADKLRFAREMYAQALAQIDESTVCLSVGGDNFCYNNWHRLAVFQEKAAAQGAASILWGCSVEPEAITPDMLDVLSTYTKIVARESITHEALAANGLTDKLILAPDPAFGLEPAAIPLPEAQAMIGVNISPLVVRREARPGILLENVRALIGYITESLGCDVLFIPHVVMPADNDFMLLREFRDALPESEKRRLHLLDGRYGAAEYKYAISKCAALVCARTHASIAAYSMAIPALVLGYSVKARGIARDLDMAEHVLDLETITSEYVMRDAFIRLWESLETVRTRLRKVVPPYKMGLNRLVNAI